MKNYITCPNCGAEYSYEEERVIFRDKDEQCCQCCGNILMSWNGSRIYTNFKLLNRCILSNSVDNSKKDL